MHNNAFIFRTAITCLIAMKVNMIYLSSIAHWQLCSRVILQDVSLSFGTTFINLKYRFENVRTKSLLYKCNCSIYFLFEITVLHRCIQKCSY